jgi:HEAT repeat protein
VSKRPDILQPERELFKFAKDNNCAVYWCADQDLVKEVLTSAFRQIADADFVNHFADAFDAPTGSANMALVREFIDCPPGFSLKDWIQSRNDRNRISNTIIPDRIDFAESMGESSARGEAQPASRGEATVPPSRATSQESLPVLLKGLVEHEIKYVNEICIRRSKMAISELHVGRSFRGVALPGEFAPPDKRGWSDLTENLTGFVLLGNAGFGKTLELLNYELSACLELQTQLRLDSALELTEDKIALKFYIRASELVAKLGNRKTSLIEAAVHHLEQAGRIRGTMALWIQNMLSEGRGTLIVDGLDEVSEAPLRLVTESPKARLLDSLNAHIRTPSACAVIIGTRKLGYDIDEALPLLHWELLPFTDGQLAAAIKKWFPNPEWQHEFNHVTQNMPPFEDMLRIPVLLMLAAQMYQEAFQAGEAVPSIARRVDFYLRALNRYRKDWIKRMGEAGNTPTRAQQDQFLPFLEEVGWNLWSTQAGSSEFSGSEINEAIHKSDIPAALRNRDVYKDVCESGMLTTFDGPSASYEFLHRTLLEFLAASYLVRRAETRGATVDVWGEIQRLSNTSDSSVPWMAAGLLQKPGVLIDRMCQWAVESPLREPYNSSRSDIAELLIDCLYECHSRNVSQGSLHFAWVQAARTLDTNQRIRGRHGDEWTELADWSLVIRILQAVKIHEGSQAQTGAIEDVLKSLRHTHEGNTVGRPNEVIQSLRSALTSSCPAVRWIVIWAIGALSLKKWPMSVSERLRLLKPVFDLVEPIYYRDTDKYVKAISGRALVQTDHPQAFRILTKTLNNAEPEAAAAAAIALSAISSADVIPVLKSKADAVLLASPSDDRNVVLGAVIGALETVVGKMKLTSDKFSLQKTLIGALQSPSAVARSSAASALGRMHIVRAWPIIAKVFEAPRTQETEGQRGSLSFACQQLAPLLTDTSERAHAANIFRRILSDNRESPNVRKPAASALGDLVRGDHFEIQDIRLLQKETRDPAIRQACLFALTRMHSNGVAQFLIPLLKEDISIRSSFCQVVAMHPSGAGLKALLWLLDNDKRLPIQLSAFHAIVKSTEQAKGRAHMDGDNYGTDEELQSQLAMRCISSSESRDEAIVLGSIVALGALFKLPLFKTSGALSELVRTSFVRIRELTESGPARVKEVTAAILGRIGEKDDIEFLRQIEAGVDDEELKLKIHSAAQYLLRRLDTDVSPRLHNGRT